ncbi:hypothetical protein BXP70_23925 [Hymenobacter crusticola]|uniref:Uncharacterized protein n=1 Tax=Hymenobacter crusticola TaxID=1770526 RepID=A0A2C9ZU07_9BACT|nr:hypothetical protein BXP70_23925 [Hymenobacter crusticola]
MLADKIAKSPAIWLGFFFILSIVILLRRTGRSILLGSLLYVFAELNGALRTGHQLLLLFPASVSVGA